MKIPRRDYKPRLLTGPFQDEGNVAGKTIPERIKSMGSSRAWDPLGWDFSKELDEIRNRLDRIFGSLVAQSSVAPEKKTAAAWVPLVDVTEDQQEFLIKAEVPEVPRNN